MCDRFAGDSREPVFENPGRFTMASESFSRKIGFLRAGWWIVHIVGITAVYMLGHFLWR